MLSLQFPILRTFAFSVFTFNPEIDWNFVRTAMPSLKTDWFYELGSIISILRDFITLLFCYDLLFVCWSCWPQLEIPQPEQTGDMG